METRTTCPFGHKCEEAKEGFVERCALYVEMQGRDATGGTYDEWRCSLAWMPILQVEMSSTSRGVAASVQSLRNENSKRQDAAMKVIDNLEKNRASLDHK